MAGPHTWVGQAGVTPQIYTLEFTTAPSDGDTFSVTITGSNRVLSITFGAVGITATDAAIKIENLLTSGHVINDEYFNIHAGRVGELFGISVIRRTTKLTIIGNGSRPLALTFAKTGDLVFTSATVQAATGPHHADNVENWSTGAKPAVTEEIIYDSGNIDCKYALDQISNVGTLRRTPGYKGRIGLESMNSDLASFPFGEFLPTHLVINSNGDVVTGLIDIESDPTDRYGFTRIDDSSKAVVGTVFETSRYSGGSRPVEIIGGNGSSKYNFLGGIIGFTGGAMIIYVGRRQEDVKFPNVLHDGSAASVIKIGGYMKRIDDFEISPPAASLYNYGGDYVLHRGSIENNVVTKIFGGNLIINSDEEDLPYMDVYSGGCIDFSRDSRPKRLIPSSVDPVVAQRTITRHGANALVKDPNNVVGLIVIVNNGAPMTDLKEMGTSGTWTRS